jgi:hypothetical protein
LLAGTGRAVVLVDPNGVPVGGQFQTWADQAKVPTINTPLAFFTDCAAGEQTDTIPVSGVPAGCDDPCGVAAACSWGPPFDGTGSSGTFVSDPAHMASPWLSRNDLYFELGHQFDWHMLTWHDRYRLARIWRVVGKPWLNSLVALNNGTEDGLSADFASAYSDCAWGGSDAMIGGLEVGNAPAIYPRNPYATCALIRSIGASGKTTG